MIIVGVTGGIGSGKTTLCREWEKMGAKVIYADQLAQELMVHDRGVVQQLIRTFGEATYHRDGSLNKPHLIQEAFKKNRVEELNNIVHPAVATEFEKICALASQAGEKMVVKEAALLLNKGRPADLNVVVILLSDREKQIARTQKRDGTNRDEILDRMSKQPDFEALRYHADYVVQNNGTLEELRQKSRELFRVLIDR